MVRNRRDSSGFHTVEHAGVFNSNRHWMSCEALGVGNHEFVGAVREGIPSRHEPRIEQNHRRAGV